ncbi:thiamine phosphate synthase [Halogeometricum limi]|uniref:Thiamine-phosphate synthase n=1 Tax=Halogeometricum limi TaxID=555875 RepID=A0A1I6IAJ6_9EURY|nr:thiamine phosphate synthase [Halogeometricum limi]SFR63400.1 thiamine-phosphate pyrophosphorylase [Halogeometricum limi]
MRTYLVTQSDHSLDRGTADVVRAAIEGGVDVVQLREKHATARERYELGRELRELTREADVPLVVNDRLDLAVAVDADGVHLGDDDLPVSVAREQLGDGAIVGRSVSTVEAAREAERAGADYLGVGAVFATRTKDVRADDAEIGLSRVEAIAEAVEIPFVGIGGVTSENAGDVVAAGADGVAVVSEITAADDPAAATRRLRAAVEDRRVEA